MIIAQPPLPLDTEGRISNLNKQQTVFNMVVNHQEDVVVPAAWHEPMDRLLNRVHDAAYVAGVRTGALVNGFGDFDPAKVAHAEQSTLCLLAAARAALEAPAGQRVAFAPASGFHHAKYASGGGYCTFNGLMAAAAALKEAGLLASGMLGRVLVVDGDGHYGDGTQDIIGRLGASHWVMHLSLSRGSAPAHRQASFNQDRLMRTLTTLAESIGLPDLVLYQAGADAHIDDPYRAGYLTDSEWDVRDMALFNWCWETNTPVAWCLAGGYNGLKTLNLHSRTFASALRVYEPGSTRLVFGQGHASSTAETSGLWQTDPERARRG